MRVLLLNDGTYGDMEAVKFPVEVEGRFVEGDRNHTLIEIHKDELLRVGADPVEWASFEGTDGYCAFLNVREARKL